MNLTDYRPVHQLALIEILPREDEITDYRIDSDGRLVDLSETPLPADKLAVVRQWTSTNNPSTLRYAGERHMPNMRRARVLRVGPEVTDIKAGDIILVGIFCGLEVSEEKDLRYIREQEALLVVGE